MAGFSIARWLAAGSLVLMPVQPAAAADTWHQWMSEERLKAEFVGGGFEGYYSDRSPWAETYFTDGHITYKDSNNNWAGAWSFRGNVFCTFYNGGVDGGCFLIEKSADNCYDFYTVEGDAEPSQPTGKEPLYWNARGWRKDQPSGCMPYVGS